MNLDDIIEAHRLWPEKETLEGTCPRCKRLVQLILTSSMTMYEDSDLNSPFYACKECSQEYIERMEEQWEDYYRGCR